MTYIITMTNPMRSTVFMQTEAINVFDAIQQLCKVWDFNDEDKQRFFTHCFSGAMHYCPLCHDRYNLAIAIYPLDKIPSLYPNKGDSF